MRHDSITHAGLISCSYDDFWDQCETCEGDHTDHWRGPPVSMAFWDDRPAGYSTIVPKFKLLYHPRPEHVVEIPVPTLMDTIWVTGEMLDDPLNWMIGLSNLKYWRVFHSASEAVLFRLKQ